MASCGVHVLCVRAETQTRASVSSGVEGKCCCEMWRLREESRVNDFEQKSQVWGLGWWV
jgi:hypothetical protein